LRPNAGGYSATRGLWIGAVWMSSEHTETAQRKTLFKAVSFTSHAGIPLAWKIECDALTSEDWAGLACIASELLPPFGIVEGVPRGGIPFADALRPYVTQGPLLIVDDVCTTGLSMTVARNGRPAIGVVAFARGDCPDWVTALFSMPRPFGIGTGNSRSAVR
jgi:hypothetical protein